MAARIPDQASGRSSAGGECGRRDRRDHGWSTGYTRGVLFGWKMTAAYCRAVLSYDQRIALDGALAEPVDAKAKDLATQIAAKAAKKAAVMAKPKPAAPLAAPPPLRDRACRTPAPGRIGVSRRFLQSG